MVSCAVDEVLHYFPSVVRHALRLVPMSSRRQLEEIRLRCCRPVMVVANGSDHFLRHDGILSPGESTLIWEEQHAEQFLEAITRASLYAMEDDVRAGFLTLPGGHRVGLTGEAVMQGGQLQTIKYVSCFNVRLARAIPGVADNVLPAVVCGGRLMHTLIASAPGCGKTTLLRDIIRQVSVGVSQQGLAGLRVAVADERSEIAACWRGIPQLDLGPRTDVLDGCRKAEGIMLLLRSMSPQVIATDEVGSEADAAALEEALYSGVTLLATAHGATLAEVEKRPGLARLVRQGAFERLVLLSRRRGPGTVEQVVDLAANRSGDQVVKVRVAGMSP